MSEQDKPTRDEIRDLVNECGLDWHRGFVPLFHGDDTNRYEVLVRAAIAADRAARPVQPSPQQKRCDAGGYCHQPQGCIIEQRCLITAARPVLPAQAESVAPMSQPNRLVAYSAAAKLRELGYEWNGDAWFAARPVLTGDVLLSVIQRLNSNPYSLTKSECIAEVEAMRAAATQGGKP